MKCKDTKKMVKIVVETAKNGAKMAKGECEVCGCKMCRILPKDYKEEPAAAAPATKKPVKPVKAKKVAKK